MRTVMTVRTRRSNMRGTSTTYTMGTCTMFTTDMSTNTR
jgi:hypothetical protein